ncbi:ethanolamine ammonia-lyase reactivating factor EutA [Ammoniphilus sp. YIM 78166]|uniref:ethanolamine ammonia-lyase reactivating factor EutA n=1 Tax=Ammoniphilus sp. YIM 78166 TaxID=1644106 RepID=UPI00106F96C7|nr:ethanolamine ammonia-lyase reactivating factor EutA [Ammoniphilus sp. YIM 78166]
MNWITSMGLDIGTSTTKLIISRLWIGEMGSPYGLPRCQIKEREILYASPIYTTPLKNENEIDMHRLGELLTSEYEQARLSLHDMKAGAVIMTGETARKENAERILHYLADRAGDFVVATAGADLEGILAGKGSGAMKRSEETDAIIANVDIGGGTANVALFYKGRAIQTFTFHVGGRLIRVTEQGLVEYVSEHLKPWLQANGWEIQEVVTYERLWELCLQLSQSLLSFLSGSPEFHAEKLLLAPLTSPMMPIGEVMFSGGVGQMMPHAQPQTLSETATYHDIGPLLAFALKVSSEQYDINGIEAAQTTRATVIGAGMQTTEVSGSTVYVKEALLPIKNVPMVPILVRVHENWEEEAFRLRLLQALVEGKKLFLETRRDPPFAIALSDVGYCSYLMLQSLADALSREYTACFPQASLMLVLCESDMAKALGQALAKRCGQKPQVICLDQIDFSYGDYIDLGLPVAGEAISISIKTLAFG